MADHVSARDDQRARCSNDLPEKSWRSLERLVGLSNFDLVETGALPIFLPLGAPAYCEVRPAPSDKTKVLAASAIRKNRITSARKSPGPSVNMDFGLARRSMVEVPSALLSTEYEYEFRNALGTAS